MPDTPGALVVGRLEKGGGEDLVVRRNHHQGNDFIDLRVFTADQTGKVGLPRVAGLCLSPDKWRELLPLLQTALDGDGDGQRGSPTHTVSTRNRGLLSQQQTKEKITVAKDARSGTCPTCGEGIVKIGEQCGLCGKYCTEARLQARQAQREEDERP